MIQLNSQRDQDFVIEAVRSREPLLKTPLLEIGGIDFSDRIPDGDYAQDGIALSLEATFVGPVPLKLYEAPMNLSVAFGDVLVPAMRGYMTIVEPQDDSITDKITAVSAGGFADKFDLNEEVVYYGNPPHQVMRDALRRLPYPGSIQVDYVTEPPIYAAPGRGEDEAFTEDQKVNDILDKVIEKVPYVVRDNAWGGNETKVSPGLARVPVIPDYLRFREDELLFWVSPALAISRFARVVVFRKNQDGSDAFPPVVANVPSRNPDFPTPYGLTERIPWTGDAASAQKHGYERTLFLGRGQYKNEPTLPFFPLLECTDVFSVTEVKEEDRNEGYWEREWLHYIDTFDQSWGEGGGGTGNADTKAFSTNPSCSVGLLNEQLVKAPILNMLLVSGGIIKTSMSLAFSSTSTGFYRESSLTDYVTSDTTGLYVDIDLSDDKVSHGSSGFSFDLT